MDVIAKIHKTRIVAVVTLAAFLWAGYDIHQFYKAHFFEMEEWQVVPLLGYAATISAVVKFVLSHILEKYQADEN